MKHPYLSLLCTGCLALSSLLSCSDNQVDDFFKKVVKAPPSSIERDVKGHDQIYAVHAILRMAIRVVHSMLALTAKTKSMFIAPSTRQATVSRCR